MCGDEGRVCHGREGKVCRGREGKVMEGVRDIGCVVSIFICVGLLLSNIHV